MAPVKIVVTRENRDGRYLFNLELPSGINQGSDVEKEFLEIVGKHSVVEAGGGCYEENALTSDHQTLHFLGGMYVSPDKLDAVLADLRILGYAIERKAA